VTPAEFQGLVNRFAVGPAMPVAGQRHVYLWHGDPDSLRAMLPPAATCCLDLHALVRALPRKPEDEQAARQLLAQTLEQALQTAGSAASGQQFVLVTGCDLLMRYRVSMGAMFRAASDSRMLILVAPAYREPAQPLPAYVDFRADATFGFLRSWLENGAVIEQAAGEPPEDVSR